MSDVVKKGDPDFEEVLEELGDSYVRAHYPGLGGYAYDAEIISISDAEDIMEQILDDIVEIDWPEDSHPKFKLKGEDEWRYIQDSGDFPQPSEEGPEDEEEEGDEEEDEEEGEEGDEEEGKEGKER